ncbi:MAG TPA: NAD(P)H-binding protein [Candidatus Angelobacter sp.]
MNTRTAVVLGASGLVGSFCLRALVDDPDYSRVVTFGRKELPAFTRAKVAQRVADLESLTAEDFRGAQDVFCALGTTIRKAGSQAAFRHVDLDLPLRSAREALNAGVEQFIVVSSVGADAASKNFYLRTKGELERELARLPFKAVHILRPSLLIGKRAEFRLAEALAMALAPALDLVTLGALRKYHSVRAETVGRAMVAAAKQLVSGASVDEYDGIVSLGKAA